MGLGPVPITCILALAMSLWAVPAHAEEFLVPFGASGTSGASDVPPQYEDVGINLDALGQPSMTVTAFGRVLNVTHEETVFRNATEYVYIGSTPGSKYDVLIAVADGGARMEVSGFPGIVMMPDGRDHRVFHSLGFNATHEGDSVPDFNPDHAEIVAGAAGDTYDDADYNHIQVDIAFGYTTAADTGPGQSEVRRIADIGVKRLNAAMRISDIPVRFNNADVIPVRYAESDSLAADLGNLVTLRDRNAEALPIMRDEIEADIGILFAHNEGDRACGLVPEILADSETAYAIINTAGDCISLTLGHIIAHEVGHLFGARHNNEIDGATEPFRYGHGYDAGEHNRYTLMTYPCPDVKLYTPAYHRLAEENFHLCQWETAFSDPDRSFFGLPTRVPAGAERDMDNARVVTEMGPYIASLGGPRWSYVNDSITDVPPHAVAEARAPREVFSGETVRLDATGSTDVDSGRLTYSWVQLPNGAPAVQLDRADSAVASFVPGYNGTRTQTTFGFNVTVGDGTSNSTAHVQVNVTLAPDPDVAGHPFSLYVANHGDNNIVALEPDGTYIGEVASIGSSRSDRPRALAFGPDGLLYVGQEDGDIVRVLDDGTLEPFAAAGPAYDMEFNGDDLYVWAESGVRKFTPSGASSAVWPAGTGPRDAEYRGGTFGPDGLLYVLNGSSWLLSYDGSSLVEEVGIADFYAGEIDPYSMDFFDDGTFLVGGWFSGYLLLYAEDGWMLESHYDFDDPTGITLAPDNKFYAVSEDDDFVARITYQGYGSSGPAPRTSFPDPDFVVEKIASRHSAGLDDPRDIIAGPTLLPPDGDPPTIIPPPDVTFEATGAQTPAAGLDLGMPNVTDRDPSPAVTNDAPDEFELGTTTVTWTATDAAGNAATATQVVTIRDTTPPAVTAPPDIELPSGPGGAAVPVPLLGTATATDGVDDSVEITSDAPALFAVGVTAVVWTGTDDSGNSGNDTQSVTVLGPGAGPAVREDFESGLGAFESGKGGWTAGTSLARPPGADPSNGVARAENCHPVCTMRLAGPLGIPGDGGALLGFDRFISTDLYGRDRLAVQIHDGTGWRDAAAWHASDGYADSQWHRESVPIPAGYLASDEGLRILAHNHGPAKRVLIDNVSLVAGSADYAITAPPDATFEATGMLTYIPPHLLGTAAVSGAAPATSNAPAVFGQGAAEVVWTASAPPGAASSAVQRVTVTAPPGLDPDTILHEDFEEDGLGWFVKLRGLWTAGTTQVPPPGEGPGNKAARTSNCGEVCALRLVHPVDLSGYGGAVLELDRFVSQKADAGEGLSVQINSGSGWQRLAAWGASDGHADSQWHRESIPLGPEHMAPGVLLRIWADVGGNHEKVFVDNVLIRQVP